MIDINENGNDNIAVNEDIIDKVVIDDNENMNVDIDPPMYKKQADPIFSPAGTNILQRVFLRLKT